VQGLGRREAPKDKGTLCNQAAGFRDSRPESVGTPGEPADLELADELRWASRVCDATELGHHEQSEQVTDQGEQLPGHDRQPVHPQQKFWGQQCAGDVGNGAQGENSAGQLAPEHRHDANAEGGTDFQCVVGFLSVARFLT